MQNKMLQHFSRHRVAYLIVALLITVGAFTLVQSVPNFRGLNNNGLTGNIGDLSSGNSGVYLQDYQYRVEASNGSAASDPIVFQSDRNGNVDLYLVSEDPALATTLIASGVSPEMGQRGYEWKIPRGLAAGEYRIGIDAGGVLDTTDIPFAIIQPEDAKGSLATINTLLSSSQAALDAKLDQLLRVNANIEVKQVEVNNLIKQADATEAQLTEYVILLNSQSSTSNADSDGDGMTNDLEYTSGSTSTTSNTDSDNDGLSDDLEFTSGDASSTSDDPDGDGFPTDWEITSGDSSSTSTSDSDSDDLSDQDVKLSSQLLAANLSGVRLAQAELGSGGSELEITSEYTTTDVITLSTEEIEMAIESLSLQLSREKLAIEVAQSELAELQLQASALQAGVADYRVRVKVLEQAQMELQNMLSSQTSATFESATNTFSAESADSTTSMDDLTLQISAKQDEILRLETQIKALSVDLAASEQEIYDAQLAVDMAQAEVDKLNMALSETKDEKQMAELELALKDAENNLNTSLERLSSGKRINSAYAADMDTLELQLANANSELDALVMEMESLSTTTR